MATKTYRNSGRTTVHFRKDGALIEVVPGEKFRLDPDKHHVPQAPLANGEIEEVPDRPARSVAAKKKAAAKKKVAASIGGSSASQSEGDEGAGDEGAGDDDGDDGEEDSPPTG